MKEDNISQLGDYDAPFCEQQYTHGSCYISLFKFKSSFDQLIPPKLPQIFDIYSVVALKAETLGIYFDTVGRHFRCDRDTLQFHPRHEINLTGHVADHNNYFFCLTIVKFLAVY